MLYLCIISATEPGSPQNLRVVNFGEEERDNFVLQWDKPKDPNGAILGYKVGSVDSVISYFHHIQLNEIHI